MPTPVSSWVQTLELIHRSDHRDSDGGGQVVRTFYVEPYTSYPALITALKGTVTPGVNEDSRDRIKPSYDPNILKAPPAGASASVDPTPFFYCIDTKVMPFAPAAVRGAASKQYQPATDLATQLTNLQTALTVPDSFDFDCNPDGLDPAQIAKGVADYSDDVAKPCFTSKGNCGAIVQATYAPLVWLEGWPDGSASDPFDYLDPVWTPITKLSQLGRDLSLFSNYKGGFDTRGGGLSDTASIPEGMWELTLWRKMVSYLPTNAISRLTNRVNNSTLVLGNQKYPAETVRVDSPSQVVRKMAPDGQIYYDIQYHFTIRILRDYLWDASANGGNGAQSPVMQPVDWNHQLAIWTIPIFGIPAGQMNYWPVGFQSSAWTGWFGGPWRPVYLTDTQFDNPAGAPGNMLNPWGGIPDLFNRGWEAGDSDFTSNR